MNEPDALCPWCRAETRRETTRYWSGMWAVFCRGCGACGPKGVTADEAVAKWNDEHDQQEAKQ